MYFRSHDAPCGLYNRRFASCFAPCGPPSAVVSAHPVLRLPVYSTRRTSGTAPFGLPSAVLSGHPWPSSQASRSASALGRHRICATKSARTLPACPQDSVPMGGWPLSDKDSRLPHLHALEGRAAESSGHSIKRRQALLDVPTFAQRMTWPDCRHDGARGFASGHRRRHQTGHGIPCAVVRM